MERILPPRLEDAGLEDCALSPESIKLAFLKAANAVGSVLPTTHQLHGDDYAVRCVDDPAASSIGELPNPLPGVPDPEEHPCSNKDVGLPNEVFGDAVVMGCGRDEVAADADRLTGVSLPSLGRTCDAGLEDNVGRLHGERSEEEEEDQRDGMPILAEECI